MMSTHGPVVTDSFVSPSCFSAAEKNNTFFPWKPSYVHDNMQTLLSERYACSYIPNSQPIHLRKLDVLSKSVLIMLALHFASFHTFAIHPLQVPAVHAPPGQPQHAELLSRP